MTDNGICIDMVKHVYELAPSVHGTKSIFLCNKPFNSFRIKIVINCTFFTRKRGPQLKEIKKLQM